MRRDGVRDVRAAVRSRTRELRQLRKLGEAAAGNDTAGTLDHKQTIWRLPERERLPLGNPHIDRIGIAAAHLRIRNPVERHQAGTRGAEVKVEDRLSLD